VFAEIARHRRNRGKLISPQRTRGAQIFNHKGRRNTKKDLEIAKHSGDREGKTLYRGFTRMIADQESENLFHRKGREGRKSLTTKDTKEHQGGFGDLKAFWSIQETAAFQITRSRAITDLPLCFFVSFVVKGFTKNPSCHVGKRGAFG
jgi:hypothetical protein